MKYKIDIVLFLFAVSCLTWAVIATIFTLSGAVEASDIGDSKIAYITNALTLLLGSQVIGISFFTWVGLSAFILLGIRKLKN